MDEVSDAELAKNLAAGDRSALETLYVRHSHALRALAATHLHDPEDVQDVVQDAFLDAAAGISTYDARQPFLPWLRSVCRHRLWKYLRRRRVTQNIADVEQILVTIDQPDDDPLTGASGLAALKRCLDKLSAEQQLWLKRRYGNGETVAVIAADGQRDANALAVALHRLRSVLRSCVERHMVGLS